MTICQACGERPGIHKHHRKLRSQGGGNEPNNILSVCITCHHTIHANPSESYARGLLVHSWADPSEVEVFTDGVEDPGEDITEPSEPLDPETVEKLRGRGIEFPDWTPTLVQPGETCDRCKRRVPHKKKASTPKSRVFSTRVPLENAESFSELVDAAAEHHGLTARPYHRYLCLLFGVTLLLQQPKGELPVG